jgi:phenylalanyl-tRNA synthetase beta chain
MKFTHKWLSRLFKTTHNPEDIANACTALGHELEECITLGDSIADIVVGYVESRQQHPDADKLSVCIVNDGQTKHQVVCGAPNVREGLKIAFAPIGAVLPGDFKIKTVKIRGVDSSGMICSENELKLGEDHSGIMELDQNAHIGMRLVDHLGLNDSLYDLSITPDRSDCFGVMGIARDLEAKGLGAIIPVKPKPTSLNMTDDILGNIDRDLSKRFMIHHLHCSGKIHSIVEIQQCLSAIGMNPKQLSIDLTNYMSISYARPMHCYDANKIKGRIHVKRLDHDTDFVAIDQSTYRLKKGDVVVTDDEKVIAIAGVMGSLSSCVDENTTRIYLEVADFDKNQVAKVGQRLGLITDSRMRFERGVDVEFMDKASQIVLDLFQSSHKDVSYVQSHIVDQYIHQAAVLEVDLDEIRRYISIDVNDNAISDILNRLGFVTSINGKLISCEVPSWRHDVMCSVDIMADVARVVGFDSIRSEAMPPVLKRISDNVSHEHTLKQTLASRGLDEVMTWSFISEKYNAMFSESSEPIDIVNPIHSEQFRMRGSLTPGLLTAVVKNENRQIKDNHFFECGHTYSWSDKHYQSKRIGIVRSGSRYPLSLHNNTSPVDLFDIKADIISLIEAYGYKSSSLQVKQTNAVGFHPKRCGQIQIGKHVIATFGQCHPSISEQFGLSNPPFIAEFYPDALQQRLTKPKPFGASVYQPVERDFAFVVSSDVPVSDIITAIQKVDKHLIQSVTLFDIYSGKNLPENSHSLAFKIILQANDRTLSEENIKSIRDAVVSMMEKRFNAFIR